MIKVSSRFKKQMEKDARFYECAEVTLSNGEKLSLDENHFTASNNSITDGAGGSNFFPIGVAVQKYVQIEIINDCEQYKDYDFFGAKIRLFMKLKLDADGEDAAATETVEKGTYTVISPETYGETIIITAYDDMYKADAEYKTNLTFPNTAGAVLRDICSTTGMLLGNASFLNDDFIIQEKPDGTFRQIIGYIAGVAAGNARIDITGKLQIMTWNLTGFSDTSNYHLLKQFQSPKLSANDILITGVKTVIKGDSTGEDVELMAGTADYTVAIENPLLSILDKQAASKVLQDILTLIGGFPLRPFEGDMVSNPLVEFMDLAKIEDRRGNQYNTVITDVNFVFMGFTTVKNTAPGAQKSDVYYKSPSDNVEIRVRKLLQKNKTEWERAADSLSKRMDEAGGTYTTIVTDEETGAQITYTHNKPKLEESNIIWKETADARAVSTDGGKTWNAGITVDGTLIAKILYAIGINADWIRSGSFTVADGDGNILFLADKDTNQVILSGDSVHIGDKTLSKALQDVKDSATALSIHLDNEYQGIPTDYEGNYTKFPTVQTSVQVFYGHSDVSADCSYSAQESSSVTGTWDNSTRTYTVRGLTADTGWVDITATYLNALSVTKRFNVAKIKDGQPGAEGEAGRTYFMEPSTMIVKRSQDNSIVPNYITLNAYYRDGADTARAAYAGRFKIEESLDGNTWTTVYTSGADESSITHSLYSALATTAGGAISTASGQTIGIPRDVVALRCTLYAAGGTTQMLDIQSIAVVTDVDALTHEEIFNLFTRNGEVKGIYKEGNQLYISFTYAKGGALTLGGTANTNGVLKIVDGSGNVIGTWDKDGITATKGTFSGNLSGAKGTFSGELVSPTGNIGGWTIQGKKIVSADGSAIELDAENNLLRIGWAEVGNESHAMTIRNGLTVYCGDGSFTDGHDQVRFYNLPTMTATGGRAAWIYQSTLHIAASSSKRYKNHVRDMELREVEGLLKIPVVWFKYKDDYLAKNDPMYKKEVPGLYAEDVYAAFPEGASLNDEGQIENWNERTLVPAMLKLIQKQQKEIEKLKRKDAEKEEKLEKLEELLLKREV